MKKYPLLILLLMNMTAVFSQEIPSRSIEDSVLGWMKVYNFKGAKEPMKVDTKLYSTAQLSICDSFANWIQASYIPKGGLGDVKRSVSEKLGLYNQYTASLPQSYGAYAKTYTELKYNSKGKREPLTSSHVWWGISANATPGWPITSICTPTQYYFIMPTAEMEEDNKKIKELLDLTGEKNIKPYISFWLKNEGFGQGTERVILCKDNKSPFIKITRGEYLQALETAIPGFYEREKKILLEAQRGAQEMKWLDEKVERYKTGLKKNREKYKDRLGELAMTNLQPGLSNLDAGRDVFGGQDLTEREQTSANYPVYKIDPAVAELCKKDKPQWIVIGWDYYPGANDRVAQYQHEAIINNFNFDYVYNFFFDPEKVKGQSYKPLRSPTYKEAVVVSEASEVSKKNATDKTVYFFEDFSTSTIGKKPTGWQSTLALGTTSVVTKLDGLNGNWATVFNYTIKPTPLKTPLPQNFTLSYELVAAQNFTWGARGLTFKLSKETSSGNAESYLELKLRPGFDGKDGEAALETKFPSPPGYSNGTKWYAAPGFSNNKKNNHITVTIKKQDETLQVFIDKIKIAEYEKAIPAGHLFNAMSFASSNSGENDKFYISNIKITKD